jgi:eukaryotic-like serine/threonine-protein kinase
MSALDTSQFPPGRVIAGRYRIRRLLGKGGMGAVYEAEHIALERTVALKVLLPDHATDAGVVARFMQEARAAAAIGVPGIVEVFDLGHDDGMAFIAMEKLEGEELFDRIVRDHPLPPAYVARLGVALADAIASAHEHGIIHRDLKPQNVFLAKKGRDEVVKVLDFGIAKLQRADRADTPITRTGQVFGTPLYMAPEQLDSTKELDGRVDVYAMGAILYEALSGAPPFSATSYPELVIKITTEEPPPLDQVRPDVPSVLVSLVRGAMAKDRDQRTPSAAALRDALERYLRAESGHAWADTVPSGEHPSLVPPLRAKGRRGVWWGAGAAALAAASAALFLTAGGAEQADGSDGVVAAHDAAEVPEEPPATEPSSEGSARDQGEPSAPGSQHSSPAEGSDHPPEGANAEATVVVHARPSDAQIQVAGKPPCTSPCALTLGDEPVQIRVERRGYRTVRQRLAPPWPEELSFDLERRPATGGATPRSTGTDLPGLLPR